MRLGADPEVFIAYGKSVVSAIGRVGGTKQEPLQIEGLPAGFTVQQDNVALEFGIPPCKTKEEFVKAIKIIRERGLSMVKPLDTDPQKPLKFGSMSCTVFPPKELLHPASHIFGCEPDFNAWTNKENLPPIVPKPGMRSAGGHIHVETDLPKQEVIKALDVTIGLATIFMDKGKDRRKFYGKPGAYRPKPYGVEYRVPSNFWIFKDVYVGSMWLRAKHALDMVNSGVDLTLMGNRIQNAILNEDKDMAKKLMGKYGCTIGTYESEMM